MNVLLCTLGASWAVVPEVFAFLAPDLLDLYRWHPQSRSLRDLRQRHAFQPPDELWICTTGGAQTERSLALLEAWWIALGAPLPLRVWTAANTDQLASQAECDRIRELTFRLVLLASERSREGGQLVLCLAGGRKTMSADLQSAGALFGACAWLHVVGPDPLPAELRDPTPDLMARPLPQALAGAVIPLVVGRGTRSELIDIDDHGRIDSTHFSVPLARPRCDWVLPDEGASLTAELERRQRQGSQLMGNFLMHLAEREPLENWRSLYRLPPRIIDGLRRAPLCSGDAGWLAVLPKADLHRHLGGSLSIAAQRSVGRAIWDAESVRRRAAALDTVAGLLRSRADWPWSWPADLKSRGTEARALGCAALLVEASDEQLERNLYGVTEPRLALKFQSAHGFDAYERPGELSGSALLGHVAALSPYAAALVTQARQEGLVYAELRGSPHKYRPRDPASFVAELCSELRSYGGTCADGCHFGFVWILDRRQRESLDMVIGQAVAARQTHPDFLYGLDLAGDEGSSAPEALAACFTPA
ncbi:MAG: adenosine deaminase, partial [Burkholderiales bacterium]|nr:adenosine deaminase [Burkholderiales bacterium]